MTTVLDREMYSEAEAARLLRMSASTLHYWLEGGTFRGKVYSPVIRAESRGGARRVTWAEFVEAGLLRGYRKQNVPMAGLRAFIDELRDSFQVPYPLAHLRPFVSGRDLVLQAQERAGLNADYWLVVSGGMHRRQLLLTAPADSFLTRVEWDDDIATGWRPHEDTQSTVRIDPDLRFGRPNVGGISTEVIWEQSLGGLDPEEIAEMYDLALSDVRWALAYEYASHAA